MCQVTLLVIILFTELYDMFVGVLPPRGVIPTECPEPWILSPGFCALQLKDTYSYEVEGFQLPRTLERDCRIGAV